MKKNNSFLTTLCVVIFGLFASGIGCGGGGGGGGSSTGGGSGESGSGDSGGGDSGGGFIDVSQEDIANKAHTFVLSNGVTIQFTYPSAGLNPPDVLSVSGDTLDVFYADIVPNQKYTIYSISTTPLYSYELNVTWTSTTTGTLTGMYDNDYEDLIPAVAVTGSLTVAE